MHRHVTIKLIHLHEYVCAFHSVGNLKKMQWISKWKGFCVAKRLRHDSHNNENNDNSNFLCRIYAETWWLSLEVTLNFFGAVKGLLKAFHQIFL